ncbi:restriction endonuclease subunit S, partial [Metallibacterium sp.]|uniref:restriction endonuclease subunit S n=1 Tax=Metallibacterium sp. TaxID=2940281 RepID=UPI002605AF6E
MAMGTKGTKGSSDPSAMARHSRESGNPAPLAFDSMKSLDPRLRGDDGHPSDPATSTALPRLRFPEFRDAAAWKKKPLSALLDYERPDKYIVSDTAYQGSGTPVLTANKSFVLGYTRERNGIYSATPVVIFDDFTTDKKYVDFSFKVKSSAIKILKVKSDDSLRLIFELMCGIKFEPKEHKRYYISEYQDLEIAIPQRPEQQKIADCLTSLDEVIAAQGRKVEALKAHKRGLMQQLFPREGETRPRLRFPEFRNAPEWEVKKLSTLIDLVSGMHLSPDQYSSSGDVPYFTGPSDFTHEVARVTKWAMISSNVATRHNTLITVKGSGVGECWYLEMPSVAMGRQLMAVRARTSSSQFIHQFLLTKRTRFEDLAAGNLIPGLARGDILDMVAPFPKKDEQQRIADCLCSLDTRIAAETRQLAALKTHKQGL